MPVSAYEIARQLANDLRIQYGFSGVRIKKSDIKRIYKDQGVRIDYWDHKLKNLRGAYFPAPHGPSVMIAKNLPEEPQIFTLAHELKHHLTDQQYAVTFCDPTNQNAVVEKSAEVFAAELIFPKQRFVDYMGDANILAGSCTADDLVHLKVNSRTTLSYAALCKTAELLRYCEPGAFAKVKFRIRQEQLYGVPLYKRLRRNR